MTWEIIWLERRRDLSLNRFMIMQRKSSVKRKVILLLENEDVYNIEITRF